MSEIVIYTDGGVRGNGKEENVGGWGAVLKFGEHQKELYGSVQNTTNNQTELLGAIKGLEALKTTNIPVRVHCDSAYVVNGITKWIIGWKKKKWKKGDGKTPENLELWKRLDELTAMQDDIQYIWVKGHAGNEFNELADQLANKAMDELENNLNSH